MTACGVPAVALLVCAAAGWGVAMSLPVMPPDPALHAPHLVVDRERRRQKPASAASRQTFLLPADEPEQDGSASVSVGASTGAALTSLDAVAMLPLSTAISRYSEDA